MKNNNKGFSLILAMGIVIIISLIAYNILEYIVPFSREVKGVENSSKSYYLANTGIESGLYHIGTRTNEKQEGTKDFVGVTSYEYETFSSGTLLPVPGEGNSNYDDDDANSIINHDRNIISQGNPIQLSIGNSYIKDLDYFDIVFRVPNLDFYDLNSNTEILSGGTLPIVNWQLSSINNTLNASGGIILANDILDSSQGFGDLPATFVLKNRIGRDLNGNDVTIGNFYGSDVNSGNCYGSNSGCILKFSIVNKLELDSNNVSVPYLEWQMEFDSRLSPVSGNNVPLRYTKIDSAGKSVGYKKELDIKVPTETVNQAFDFAVFQ